MKNLENKKKLALLISGLALFIFNSLQCAAQTNNEEYGILVYNSLIEEYLYSIRGEIFRGSPEACKDLIRSIKNNSEKPEVTADKAATEMNRTSEHATEEIKPVYSLEVNRQNINQGTVEVAKLQSELELKYRIVELSDYCSLQIKNGEYAQIASEYVRALCSDNETIYNDFVNEKYSILCERYKCKENEADFNEYNNKFWNTLNNNFAKYVPQEQYDEWGYGLLKDWSKFRKDYRGTTEQAFDEFSKKIYYSIRKEYHLNTDSTKHQNDRETFKNRFRQSIRNAIGL